MKPVVCGFKHLVRNLVHKDLQLRCSGGWCSEKSANGWVRPSRCSTLLYEIDRKGTCLRESWNGGVGVGEVRWETAAWHRSIPGCDQPWPWSFSTSPPPTNIPAAEIFPWVSPPASAGAKVRWPEYITSPSFVWNRQCLSFRLSFVSVHTPANRGSRGSGEKGVNIYMNFCISFHQIACWNEGCLLRTCDHSDILKAAKSVIFFLM